jgi:hypothetical protein
MPPEGGHTLLHHGINLSNLPVKVVDVLQLYLEEKPLRRSHQSINRPVDMLPVVMFADLPSDVSLRVRR